MKIVAFLIGLFWAVAAQAQSACSTTQSTSVNPAVGSVYTWCGPSVGALWIPGLTGPLTSTVGDVPIFTATNGTSIGDPTGTTASRLNNRTGNFAATPNYSGTGVGAGVVEVLGSSGASDSSADAVGIFQKWSSAATGHSAALYSSAYKTASASNSHAISAFMETIDNAGGSGSFIEGLRSHAIIGSGKLLGSAYGGIFAAGENATSTHLYLVGIEPEVDVNSTDATYTFDPNNYAAGVVASSGGSKRANVGFLVNPYVGPGIAGGTASSYMTGFQCPQGVGTLRTVITSCFRMDERDATWALDAVLANNLFGVIHVANNVPVVRARNAANNADINLMTFDGSNNVNYGVDSGIAEVHLGTTTTPTVVHGFEDLLAITAPSTPGASHFRIYMNTADNKLYAKGPSGTVTVLALP
jgi:hypothetical protein